MLSMLSMQWTTAFKNQIYRVGYQSNQNTLHHYQYAKTQLNSQTLT